VVSFTPLPLYPRAKSPWYPLDKRLGGPQSQFGRYGEEKILSYRDSNSDPSVVQLVASRYTDCATPAHTYFIVNTRKSRKRASRRLPIAAARDSIPGWIMWDLWWKKWHWASFFRLLRFPRPILIPPTAPHSLIILSLKPYILDTHSVVKQQTSRQSTIPLWVTCIYTTSSCAPRLCSTVKCR
jgi:hypothetical protein